MVRGLAVLLLTAASVANAGEHYVEVWNPPEARHAPRAGSHAAPKPAAVHRVNAARAAHAKPAHVVANASKPAKHVHAAHAITVNTAPQARDLPPLLTPEGNVLRVDTHGAQPKVTR
jgi:hypothetical protein